jgi:prolipoprotein diacylglyceryltransferase
MSLSWDLLTEVVDWPTLAIAAVVALLALAYGPRRLRAAVIWIAQYTLFFALVLGTAVAGRIGYVIGGAIGQSYNLNETGQLYYAIAGAVAGGLTGLVAAALLCGLFFVLLEIRENTRG